MKILAAVVLCLVLVGAAVADGEADNATEQLQAEIDSALSVICEFYETGLATRGDLAKRGWFSNLVRFVAPIIRWWFFGKRTSDTLPMDQARNVALNGVFNTKDSDGESKLPKLRKWWQDVKGAYKSKRSELTDACDAEFKNFAEKVDFLSILVDIAETVMCGQ
ncbi:uncharacterized protein LOC131953644 [Physella acuta]|uniref:uncharacterized protein LOC131953644 n=1 Tax=Physella acuta TaxID=109671 RepID=UPI0027DE7847|nr:uncharacterized protein LOC131953644 [Physella acuta]